MNDKERILIWMVQRIYSLALYKPSSVQEWRDIQPGFCSGENSLNIGDLVVASTTLTPNDFLVGFVDQINSNCVVIREIGSDRLCNYYNESFYRIPKDILGYEILEGVQYEIYRKVLKAFSKSNDSYSIRFQDIKFEGSTCHVSARKVFSPDNVYTVSFSYNKKTSIKSIVSLLNNAAVTKKAWRDDL